MTERVKGSTGNMYDDWWPWKVLAGECWHRCNYCSTLSCKKRTKEARLKYSGPIRLSLAKDGRISSPGKNRRVFVCSTMDPFARDVPEDIIRTILARCRESDNHYLLQTKDPARMSDYFRRYPTELPERVTFATTIETNRDMSNISRAPGAWDRAMAMMELRRAFPGHEIQITIEPMLDFDLGEFVQLLQAVAPDVIYLGGDSKGHHLPEPTAESIYLLLDRLAEVLPGCRVVKKGNLDRLLGIQPERPPRAPRIPARTRHCVSLDKFADEPKPAAGVPQ